LFAWDDEDEGYDEGYDHEQYEDEEYMSLEETIQRAGGRIVGRLGAYLKIAFPTPQSRSSTRSRRPAWNWTTTPSTSPLWTTNNRRNDCGITAVIGSMATSHP
jgi:hypothetical protein